MKASICLTHPLCRAMTMAHYGSVHAQVWVQVSFVLNSTTLEGGLGARLLFLHPQQ